VAAPGHRLTAQDRDPLRRRECGEFCETVLELAGEGVVGIVLETRVLPARVDRRIDVPLPWPPAPEFLEVPIPDAGAVEPGGHRVGIELRAAARAGHLADIDDRLDVRRREGVEHDLLRARPVADRPQFTRGGAHTVILPARGGLDTTVGL